jgi:glycosyltransferase involved in cell wall biosynthesis
MNNRDMHRPPVERAGNASAERGLIIIPVYNEEENIGLVIRRLRECGQPEDLLVVDDGSTDGTLKVVRRLKVAYISHPVNLGYVQALQTGIRFAKERGYDYLVFIDGDGQHDPQQIADLRKRGLAAHTPDIVIGSRFVQTRAYQAPLGRRAGMLLFSWLTRAVGGHRIFDTTSGFKLIRRRAFEFLQEQIFGDFHAEMIVFCLLMGLRVEEVAINVSERRSGVSMYDWLSSAVYPVKTILAMTILWVRARQGRRALMEKGFA